MGIVPLYQLYHLSIAVHNTTGLRSATDSVPAFLFFQSVITDVVPLLLNSLVVIYGIYSAPSPVPIPRSCLPFSEILFPICHLDFKASRHLHYIYHTNLRENKSQRCMPLIATLIKAPTFL